MSSEPAWHDAYPQPREGPPDSIQRDELLDRIRSGQKAGKDFLLIDLRRNDHQGGSVKGSVNLPAQSLYPSLPTLLNICQSAGIELVIWYCGSSKGRGTRAALWFRDLLQDTNVSNIRSVILTGGITGWANAGDAYTQMMDEYDAKVWQKSKEMTA